MPEVQTNARPSLDQLGAGESGIIIGVAAEHLSAKRLADMGFVGGARIKMIRPGDPCVVGIGGTYVGLGRANQHCVLIAAEES